MRYKTDTESRAYQVGLKALSKYNRLAYKEILFKIMPELRLGNLLGKTDDNIHYSIPLPCDPKFIYVHGQVYLHYELGEDHTVFLTKLEPFSSLEAMHRKLVAVQDGVPITGPKDKFKLQMYEMMGGETKWKS